MTEEDQIARIEYLKGVLRDLATAVAKGTAGKIDAIRAYRAATGATLKDSKDYVEAMATAGKQTVEDSRIQRVEDRMTFLERRMSQFEGCDAVVGSAQGSGK